MNQKTIMKCFVGAVLVLCCSIAPSTADSLRIGAFNIKRFGDRKMRKTDVANRIVQIVSRYDIILIQEVRDKDESSLIKLKNMLNSAHGSDVFVYTASQPLGRSRYYKEQYAYFYRDDRVELIDTYQFDDTNYEDVFEREPYNVRMRVSTTTTTFDIALIGIHAKPKDVIKELNALDYVTQAVKSRWLLENVLVLGDLNADCSYANEEELDTMPVFIYLNALIAHDEDTTVGTSVCAYDRMNIKGCELATRLQSYGVYNFKTALSLSQSEALAISDHFPVEMVIVI